MISLTPSLYTSLLTNRKVIATPGPPDSPMLPS